MAPTALARADEEHVPAMAASRSGSKHHLMLLFMKHNISSLLTYIPRAMLIRGMVIGLLLLLAGLFDLLLG